MITMHPAEFLQEAILTPMNLNQATLARHLGVDRATVSRLLAQKADLSPEMAVRLSLAFSTTPEYWMAMQTNHSLKKAKEAVRPEEVTPFDVAPIVSERF